MAAGPLNDNLVSGVLHGATAMAAFGAVLAVLAGVRINKGARANLAMLLCAVGLALLGAAFATLVLYDLRAADATEWNDLLTFGGTLFLLAGVLYWRRLLRQLTK